MSSSKQQPLRQQWERLVKYNEERKEADLASIRKERREEIGRAGLPCKFKVAFKTYSIAKVTSTAAVKSATGTTVVNATSDTLVTAMGRDEDRLLSFTNFHCAEAAWRRSQIRTNMPCWWEEGIVNDQSEWDAPALEHENSDSFDFPPKEGIARLRTKLDQLSSSLEKVRQSQVKVVSELNDLRFKEKLGGSFQRTRHSTYPAGRNMFVEYTLQLVRSAALWPGLFQSNVGCRRSTMRRLELARPRASLMGRVYTGNEHSIELTSPLPYTYIADKTRNKSENTHDHGDRQMSVMSACVTV
jgi:hypothetical protein